MNPFLLSLRLYDITCSNPPAEVSDLRFKPFSSWADLLDLSLNRDIFSSLRNSAPLLWVLFSLPSRHFSPTAAKRGSRTIFAAENLFLPYLATESFLLGDDTITIYLLQTKNQNESEGLSAGNSPLYGVPPDRRLFLYLAARRSFSQGPNWCTSSYGSSILGVSSSRDLIFLHVLPVDTGLTAPVTPSSRHPKTVS